MSFRPRASTLISIAVHMAVAAAVVPMLAPSDSFEWILAARPGREAVAVSVRYVALPTPPPRTPRTPATPSRNSPRRTPDTAVDRTARAVDGIAFPGSATAPATPAASVDTRASLDSAAPVPVTLIPTSADPRIWNARPNGAAVEQSSSAVLEGALARAIRRSNDSASAARERSVRLSWVIGPDGRKVGIDKSRIHLGPVSIPTMVLGYLPVPGMQCGPAFMVPRDHPLRAPDGTICTMLENPTLAVGAARINEMSAEIRERAELAVSTREEIARIAARKDRERQRVPPPR